jgi:Cu(I)/Ag(I) efflux system membrane fusion protein
MTSNIKSIVIALIAALLGLVAGYLIFGKNGPLVEDQEEHSHDATEVSPAEEIWTCSMHPQIRQNEPGDCPLCGMDLITQEEGSSNDPLVLEMTPEAVKLAGVQTTVIGDNNIAAKKSLRLSGKVQADERRASTQVAHVPGRIEKLWVSFTGEQVTKGQKLAEIYSPELITAQRELLEAIKLKDINPDLAVAARNKLRYWKISEEVIQGIEEKGSIQETFPIIADASGVISKRKIAVGDYVQQGEPLFDMMNLDRIWILFDAYEEDLPGFRLGDQIEFTTPAVPEKIFKTRITFIDPVINPATRVASVRTEVKNNRGLLKPEMFVSGWLKAQPTDGTQLSVPKSAVLWTGRRSVVYVKLPDAIIPSFQYREVELGESLGNQYVVLDGLEPGEEVVTYGNFAIDAAAQLNNQASMMNSKVLIKGQEAPVEELPDYTAESPSSFRQQIGKLTQAYLPLKNALVLSNAQQARQTVSTFLKALSEIDKRLLEEDARQYWVDQWNTLQLHGQKLAELEDVEAQRKQFDFLSQTLIKTIKVFGVEQDTFYVQHCPMAFDDTGADWISDVEEIRNPYFGDRMLKCGWVEEVLVESQK